MTVSFLQRKHKASKLRGDQLMYKKFRFSKATRALIVAATAVAISGIPQTALACTQVYIGSELTTTGDTFWGRAED